MSALDRDKARAILDDWYGMTKSDVEYDWSDLFDALEECVRSTPLVGINPDEVVRVLEEADLYISSTTQSAAVDRILALVRPADGIMLTPEEAGLVVSGLRWAAAQSKLLADTDNTWITGWLAIADRVAAANVEASS